MLNTPVEFYIFGLTLAGVALLHKRTLMVAVTGLLATIAYKLAYSGFVHGVGWAGFGLHLGHEWVILSNLLLLLLGFAVLANQFELSHIPDFMPRLLPDNWLGGAALLLIVFVMSTILDNIAAAVIGAVIARKVYAGRVSLGFLAAIVACSNAGGAGSVIGDTTTTMMWIDGVSPLNVLDAYAAAVPALCITAYFAAKQQHAYSPIIKNAHQHTRIDSSRLGIVVLMALAKKSEFPEVAVPDRLSEALSINGIFHDAARNQKINWQVHRTPLGLVLFVGIGFLAGLFGMGAGWANVPVLNLLMGAPLKVSAGTSSFILTLVDSSAAWIYLNKGAVLAIIAVPSVIGMMLGAFIGARLLHVLKASVVRKMVITLLLFAGARALLKGLGIWL